MKTADVFHYVNSKIPEISLGSSDQNIRDHLGQPKFSDSSIFDKQVHHCRTSPHLCSEFGKEYKLVRARLLLVINTILGHYAHFWIFGGNFSWLAKIGSRLVARGSGSQARKIASPTRSRSTSNCYLLRQFTR